MTSLIILEDSKMLQIVSDHEYSFFFQREPVMLLFPCTFSVHLPNSFYSSNNNSS